MCLVFSCYDIILVIEPGNDKTKYVIKTDEKGSVFNNNIRNAPRE